MRDGSCTMYEPSESTDIRVSDRVMDPECIILTPRPPPPPPVVVLPLNELCARTFIIKKLHLRTLRDSGGGDV